MDEVGEVGEVECGLSPYNSDDDESIRQLCPAWIRESGLLTIVSHGILTLIRI